MMNIVLCASDNYTMPCGVTICSICVNNREIPIKFYIITDNSFTEEHKDQLSALVSNYPLKAIEFIFVKDEQVDLFLKHENTWWTRHVFYRLLSAKLLPNDVKRALYLDCDVIVRHSLESLWETDLTGKAVGCVPDGMEGVIEYYNRLGYTADKGYFNSGVLLMNLQYWRENNISEAFSSYIIENGKKLKHPDQDVLNVVLRDCKTVLQLTYNFQSAFLYKRKFHSFDYTKYKEEIKIFSKDPVILHLSGIRPWISGRIKHPYQEEFFKYRAMTIWKDDPLWPCNYSFKTRIINTLRPLGEFLGVCHVIPDFFDRNFEIKTDDKE